MPLTPAEVHNVAFKKPPIGKRGYDEEEVDAFLDIVEVELSRLIEENNDLRNRAGSGQPAPAQPAQAVDGDTDGRGGADPAELAAARDENARLNSRIEELEHALTQGNDGAAQQLQSLQQQLAQTEQQLTANRSELEQAQSALSAAQSAPQQQSGEGQGQAAAPQLAEHHQQAVQMLALAQQTADQHLAQSKAEAEQLMSEAQANAKSTTDSANEQSTRQISEAEQRARQLDEESNARANQTVQDAEQRAATITAQFEQRKAALERRVEELRTFEREYRTRLKSYLESQLRDLDASGKSEPASPNSDYAEAQ
ncbi:DivIVA domain-containing protein [uncultured Jatrophihabitans sp.]|uniref:DivIVA domain-containing protein n=1 Tax=uncultured Jatrophihabitans sp. TaxID=1610747 RepID=UPI0035CC36F1